MPLFSLANTSLGGITYKRDGSPFTLEVMMTHTFLGLVIGSILISGTAFAQSTDTPVIDQRIENQEQRIQQGVESGQLTEREANRMNRHMDRIEDVEARAKADGRVTKQERKRLNRSLDHNSRATHKQKHDRQHK
ncbi:MAG: hypothetical protein ACREJU_13030 [Nitrospiraceae bacterium]